MRALCPAAPSSDIPSAQPYPPQNLDSDQDGLRCSPSFFPCFPNALPPCEASDFPPAHDPVHSGSPVSTEIPACYTETTADFPGNTTTTGLKDRAVPRPHPAQPGAPSESSHARQCPCKSVRTSGRPP